MMQIYPVTRTKGEAKGIKTIFLRGKLTFKPGQFIMVWLPNVEEKPMAVSYLSENEFAFTYHILGAFTQACNNLKPGDKLGIRGPYGNGFKIDSSKKPIIIGGGIGMTSVALLIEQIPNAIVIHGARSKENLIFQNRFKNMLITTDDGSFGRKGFVTDILKETVTKDSIVYACGPEMMAKAVLDVCAQSGAEMQASLERMMKCGIGVCGNCMIDGHIICREGPVYDKNMLLKMHEFGKFARLKTGKKVTLKEYYACH